MEITDVNKVYSWQRKEDAHGSSLYITALGKNKRIKRKQIIKASLAQLGTRVDQFIPLDGQKVPKDFFTNEFDGMAKSKPNPLPLEVPTVKPTSDQATTEADNYEVVSLGVGWYDVVSSVGKVMNEKKLRLEAAEELKKQLQDNSVEAKDLDE